MASDIPQGLGSISPNYFVNHDKFSNKILFRVGENSYKILEKNIETKILVYEDRVNGWFLDFAQILTEKENSEFIVLMICMNYLEGNQQFREGKKTSVGESTEMLKRALKRIFQDGKEEDFIFLIDKIRHGLFHEGMTKRGIVLRYGSRIPFFSFIVNNEKWIMVEPALFLEQIKKDFADYIKILKEKRNRKERENFEKCYNNKYELP